MIALTIRVPDVSNPTAPELLDVLEDLLPRFSSYAISFWVVAILWVSLMPFSGSMLGVYGGYHNSVIVYCAHVVLASLNLAWL